MMDERAEDLIRNYDRLVTVRGQYKSTWDEVGEYINLHRQVSNAPGAKKTSKIYSSAVIRALGILVAGLHSLLTSPTLPWFRLKMSMDELNENDDIKRWLEEVELRMYAAFSQSFLYNAMTEFYRDMGSYSVGGLYLEEGVKRILNVESMSPYQFVYAENNQGEIDTVFREIPFTARQAIMEFPGKVLNEALMQMIDSKQDQAYTKTFPFLHVVCPRNDRLWYRKDSLNLPFASYYIDVTDKKIVEESGYHEFPYAIARWEKPADEPYGLCPAIISLPDVKTTNVRKRNMLIQEDKILNPPLDVPEGYKGRINTAPNGLNFRSQGKDRIAKLDVAGNLEYSAESLTYDVEQINNNFYVDVFRMLANIERQMTAYEVSKREAERMLMFGPVIGRLTTECLQNIITRSFAIMMRGGYLPAPPEQAMQQDYEIEYISPLARAQKAGQGNSLQEALAFIMPLAQVKSDILDNLDEDEIFRYVFDLYGCPTRLTVPPKERDQIRDMKAKIAEQQALLDAAQQGADTMGSMEKAVPGSAQRMIGA